MKNLFNKKISPLCEYCHTGEKSLDNETILCINSGVVDPSYHCKKFKYDPLKRVPKINSHSNRFKKENFII